MPTRYDNITIKAKLSKEGWIIDRPVITRAGIFTYKDNTGKTVKEYRPDEEVFKEDSLNSIRGMPITDGHKGLITTESNLDGLIVGSVMGPGAKEETNVVADIVIHNVKKIGSKRDLSLGYVCKIDETPGEWNGQKYDQIQRDINYNHLAVVHKGRAGNARIRLDADELVSFDVENDMPEIRLDNIPYTAAAEVINHIGKQDATIADLKKRLDSSAAECDTAKNALQDAIKQYKLNLDKERDDARNRVQLEEIAKQFAIKFDAVDNDRSIKEKIIIKLGNDLKFDGKSDDYVNSAYDLTLANEESKKKTTGEQKQKTTIVKQDQQKGTSSADARERMLRRIRGEKEAA